MVMNGIRTRTFSLEEQTWMKIRLLQSSFFPFQAEWNPTANQTPHQPQEEDGEKSFISGPSPHGRVLPLALSGLELHVVLRALPPAVLHCHDHGEQDQDDAAGASDRRRQDADLGHRNWKQRVELQMEC